MTFSVTFRINGPFFRPEAPAKARQAVQRAIQDLVELGEQRLDQTLRPRPGGVYLSVGEAQKGKASTGHYRRSVHGELRDMRGRIHDSGVVYGPWLEGTSSRNATTRFKGYASFRRTAQHLQQRVPVVVQARVARLLGGLR